MPVVGILYKNPQFWHKPTAVHCSWRRHIYGHISVIFIVTDLSAKSYKQF